MKAAGTTGAGHRTGLTLATEAANEYIDCDRTSWWYLAPWPVDRGAFSMRTRCADSLSLPSKTRPQIRYFTSGITWKADYVGNRPVKQESPHAIARDPADRLFQKPLV
jgi:hypothetical protein